MNSGRRFKVHEQTAGAKAMKTAQASSRILPNCGGSSTAKRRLLTSVVHSQLLLYAAPIWEPLLDHRADSNIATKNIPLKFYSTSLKKNSGAKPHHFFYKFNR